MLFSVYSSLVWASTTQEDTILVNDQSVIYKDAYIVDQYIPPTPEPITGVFQPVGNGYCVALLQAHGFSMYAGNANTWSRYIIEGAMGWPGDAILLDEGPTNPDGTRYQHLVRILSIEDDGYYVVEQNGAGGRYVITYRTIQYDYPLIVGIIPKPAENDAL